MKNPIQQTAKEFSEKFRITEDNNEENQNPQHEIQKQLKEKERHPSVKNGIGNIIFQITKDLPDIFSSQGEFGADRRSKRNIELKNIRQQKVLKEKHKQLSR